MSKIEDSKFKQKSPKSKHELMKTTSSKTQFPERFMEPNPPNKSVVFTSDQTREKMIRTGIPIENNLFHAILCNSSKAYVKGDAETREKFALDLKQTIFPPKFNKTRLVNAFEELVAFAVDDDEAMGEDAKEIIKECIATKKAKELFSLVFELVPFAKIESIIDESNSFSEFQDSILLFFKQQFEDELDDPVREKYCTSKFVTLLKLSETKTSESGNIELNSVTQKLFEAELEMNILVIDAKTRKLRGINPKLKYDKSLILLQYENGHFESIGKLLEGNYIQREFESDDRLIRHLMRDD